MLRLFPFLLFLLVLGCDSTDSVTEEPPPPEPPLVVTYGLEITGNPEFMSIRYRDASGTVIEQNQNLADLTEIEFEILPSDVAVVDNVYFIEAEGTLPVGAKADVSILVIRDGLEIAFSEDQEFATEALPDVSVRAAASLPRN
ncbi:hypothetical protein [Rubrivirga sp.]|uniref:hypothetical protein n=1 Tax=Rubrivirga sp. TaxID=1885344 RepID=UPI003C74C033